MKKLYNLKIGINNFTCNWIKQIKETLQKELKNIYSIKDLKRAIWLYGLDVKTAFWGTLERTNFEKMYFENNKNIWICIQNNHKNHEKTTI